MVFDFGEIMENENSINIKNDDMDFQRTVTKSNGVSCYKWNWFGNLKRLQNKKKSISAFFNMHAELYRFRNKN